ncbi:maleate cis-trans isomerase [Thermodesulfobacteriota bacterium]
MKKLTVAELERALGELDSAAELMASEEVDVITVGGSPIIALKGVGSDREISARLEAATKIPTICGFTAVVEALQALAIKKVAVATPYKDEQNKRHKQFLEDSGFEVMNIKGMQIDRPTVNARLPPYASYRLAKKAFLEAPDSDGIYISCSRWQTALNIEKLERNLKVPVVTNAQARIWAALKRIHVGEVNPGFGQLFETL